ncbi:NAD(P)-binding protein [Gemmatimonas sp.]|uniref:NAD(P)-binding protein n=1 Tax=Gemmatimonas sp. TaxID=1962908 RepID=UPI003DA39A53
MEQLDVLVIGAGLSGISAAWHLQSECPSLSYAIVEARERMGGTWDLFRYPGIRSDSDMYTLGYRFRPVAERQGHRRWAVHQGVHRRHGARGGY